MERWTSSILRAVALTVFASTLLLCPSGVAADEEGAGTEGQASLPLKRVLLFSSGVGFFEHRADVEGDARLELSFRADDVNDLLKSMVVQDLGGGRISTVSYGSRDPIAKALQSFAIDLTENLTMADLLAQVRGEEVYIETPLPVTGTVLSVETRNQRVKEEVVPTTYLNILTTDGLKSISFDTIRSVRLLDERLDQEMRKALEILSLGRDAQKKTVTLEFLGEGKRPVRVGYIRETPVWKTSYRLVLDDEKKPFLQGWSIVENTTDQDWEGIDLTLVSGRPISYVMNLYQPLYAERPEVQPPVRAGVGPQTYEREMMELKEELEREGAADRLGRALARRARAPARDARPGAPPAASKAAADFDIQRGVEAAATAAEVGELFQYHIAEPVFLNRQRSAMLPILNETIEGQKLSIYDPAVHPKHPLNGVLLVNSTDVHVTQGPVTVFDGGAYAGDALVGDLPPGAKRLISYAMDLEVEVAQEGRSRPDELLSVRIVKGTLYTEHKRMRERTYIAKNSDRKSRLLLIGYPFDANWTLLEPATPWEKTRNQYRFALEIEAGATKALRVAEEQTTSQQIAMTSLSIDRITYYLRARVVSSQVKEALAEVVRRKRALDDLARRQQQIVAELKAIDEEQARIRANMAEIDRTTDLYGRYLTKLSAQEDRVEALRTQLQSLQDEVNKQRKALDDYMLGLNLN